MGDRIQKIFASMAFDRLIGIVGSLIRDSNLRRQFSSSEDGAVDQVQTALAIGLNRF